jgi:hypothetical protein
MDGVRSVGFDEGSSKRETVWTVEKMFEWRYSDEVGGDDRDAFLFWILVAGKMGIAKNGSSPASGSKMFRRLGLETGGWKE